MSAKHTNRSYKPGLSLSSTHLTEDPTGRSTRDKDHIEYGQRCAENMPGSVASASWNDSQWPASVGMHHTCWRYFCAPIPLSFLAARKHITEIEMSFWKSFCFSRQTTSIWNEVKVCRKPFSFYSSRQISKGRIIYVDIKSRANKLIRNLKYFIPIFTLKSTESTRAWSKHL